MNAVMPGSAVGRPRAAHGWVDQGVPGLARGLWVIVGVAALTLALAWVVRDGLGPAPVVLFLVLPDLAFVAGAGAPAEHGQIPARAVPFYNAAHRAACPLAIIVLGVVGVLPDWWLVGGLAWLSHVALDRGFGYGLRTPDGWQRV